MKQALQESIASRDYLQQKVKLFQEALSQETKRNDRIEHENDKLVRENARLREEMSAQFAELQETLNQKAHLEARNIELSRQVAKTRSSPELKPERPLESFEVAGGVSIPEEAEIVRYLSFVVETADSVPDLRVLFQGRVHSTAELREALSSGRFSLLILRLLQVLSDFIVYYSDKQQPELGGKLSQCTQTTVDRSVVTEGAHQHSPSVSSAVVEAGPKTIFKLKHSPVDVERTLSPRFHSSPDEYTRLYEEHRTLLSSLNSQSDRLSKLNSQLSATMSSSRRLLASQTKSFAFSSSTSQPREQEPVVVQEPPVQQTASLQTTPVESPVATQTTTVEVSEAGGVKAASRSPPARKAKFPVYRAKPGVGRRPIASRPEREVRVFPTLKEEGWSSVSEFFNSANQEKKKSEESDSDAER